MSVELRNAIIATARKIGVDPVDLATAMSYETAGTFDPWKRGPTTKHGTHRGLIQWGEPQARQYGVTASTPVEQQVAAAGRYLVDRGVRPGHGLLEIYSAINAGRVGLYNRSDANNGGAPGTVRNKVENQMGGHRAKAARLLGGMYVPGQVATQQPGPVQAPGTPAPPLPAPVTIRDRPIADPMRSVAGVPMPAAPRSQGISPMMQQAFGAMAMQPEPQMPAPPPIQGPTREQATALTEFVKLLRNRARA